MRSGRNEINSRAWLQGGGGQVGRVSVFQNADPRWKAAVNLKGQSLATRKTLENQQLRSIA